MVNLIAERPDGDPYKEVLLQVGKRGLRIPYNIVTGKNYLDNLKVSVCGAVHENTGHCDYGANGCPIRNENVGCLHGLDFRYYGNDRRESRGLNMGNNIWGLRTFALSYILREQGYDSPQFVDHYEEWDAILRCYDTQASSGYGDMSKARWIDDSARCEIGESKAASVALFQRSLKIEFFETYVVPTRKAFQQFWNDRVDAEPIV